MMIKKGSMLLLIFSLCSVHSLFPLTSSTQGLATWQKQMPSKKEKVQESIHKQTKEKKKKKYLFTPPPPLDLEQRTRYRRVRWPEGVTRPTKFLGGILKDIYMLNANLFSWDSFKIIASVFPFFIGTRMLDEKIHRHFYDESHHKNIHQMPKWCSELGKYGIGIPIALLGINAFIPYNEELQTTSRIFLLGMPFVIWTKELIKKAQFDACLRPWNEHFSSRKRSLGGFPSGHMAEATYTAVLFGLRYGPKAAIPLGLVALLVATSFINCNRHYASQIIGGIGFGAMYALAGHKLVNAKLQEQNMNLSMTFDNGPALKFSCAF